MVNYLAMKCTQLTSQIHKKHDWFLKYVARLENNNSIVRVKNQKLKISNFLSKLKISIKKNKNLARRKPDTWSCYFSSFTNVILPLWSYCSHYFIHEFIFFGSTISATFIFDLKWIVERIKHRPQFFLENTTVLHRIPVAATGGMNPKGSYVLRPL